MLLIKQHQATDVLLGTAYYASAPVGRKHNKRCFCLMSVAYIVPNSSTERPSKTKIGTEVAHVTRYSDTTFKIKRSKVNLLLMS